MFFERLSFNVERRGMENKYSGMLAWEEGILYLCVNSKILSLVAKNIQASLILFHSFIRIFVRVKASETTTMAKYKEYGYDIQNGKAIILEWETEIKKTIIL